MNSDMLVRITRYYRALNRLRSIGLEKVFAHNLADAAGVSAAVVRKEAVTRSRISSSAFRKSSGKERHRTLLSSAAAE